MEVHRAFRLNRRHLSLQLEASRTFVLLSSPDPLSSSFKVELSELQPNLSTSAYTADAACCVIRDSKRENVVLLSSQPSRPP
ncbi:hypothetical protein Trydic_g18174 [Trypoxylus dichotomus]